jgi:uncharacterized protein (TIGR03790 family)
MRNRPIVASIMVAAITYGLSPVQAQVPPAERTAAMPDSWLVLYNSDPASESPAWKDWYIQQWGIPPENTLGLNVSSDERVTKDYFTGNIFYPVRDFVNGHPDLKAKLMGIMVGYRVPGNFYVDATHPALNGGGGWSVSNNLTDLLYVTWYKRSNPHAFVAYSNPNYTRLTKAALAADCYLSARLDGPTLADVQAQTLRAKTISNSPSPLSHGDRLYCDYLDPGSDPGDEWTPLRLTVQSDLMTNPAWKYPWLAYESETDPMPSCTLTFSYYRITGWDLIPWAATPPGSRIVAMAMNSWGATTVRSTTGQGARFVPNALVNGQFAAAIGATAEPYVGAEPNPSTIVFCLAEGRTLGEAFFHSNPYRNFMWEMVGDPLLRVPHWFADPSQSPPATPTDLGPPELIAGGETVQPAPKLTFTLLGNLTNSPLSYHLQLSAEPEFAAALVDYVSPTMDPGPAHFTVGQDAAGGMYSAGAPGDQLPLGTYYWRVRGETSSQQSDWAAAPAGTCWFTVVEPLQLTRAVSRKIHGTAGPLDIAILLEPQPGRPTSECRKGGPTQLVLTFNRAILGDEDMAHKPAVSLTGGTVAGTAVNGAELTITVADIPDPRCLSLTIDRAFDLAGLPLTGLSVVHLAAVFGDVNGDEEVNLGDPLSIKAVVGQPLSAGHTRMDINLDGAIDMQDMLSAKSLIPSGVQCAW